MSNTTTQSQKDYLLFIPIFNLIIDKDIGSEIKIERVTYISKDKIPRIRKRLGFAKTISQENKIWLMHNLPRIFSEAPSYAFIKFKTSDINKDISGPINKINEAFWLLASSQFYFVNRAAIRFFGGTEYRTLNSEHIIYDCTQKFSIRGFKKINPIPFKLDSYWRQYEKNHFFSYLLKILNNKNKLKINSDWKNTIRNAAILCGKSIFSKEISQAFLYNMIAIESILGIDPSDKFTPSFINRYNALFGWLTAEDPTPWKVDIERIYKLRCNMVHRGDASDLKTKDIAFSDCILFNMLYNICHSIHYFKNKQFIIELTKKIDARRILGQKIKERPNLRYFHPDVSETNINRIKKENNWP